VRTAEALLGVLTVDPDPDSGRDGASGRAGPLGAIDPDAVFAALRDPSAFGGACGPAQVHRAEPVFDAAAYWRGPAWPQLTYLFWVAARRLGRDADAAWLRDALVRGAATSGFAEYWHPDTGVGLGAVPQSWAGLAAVVATT
jgi:glycogen debranching enzyme